MINETSRAEDGTYQTTNIYQSAWLLLHDIPLEKIDRHNPKRAIFYFEDNDGQCDTLIQKFLGDYQIQKYISKIQDIKAMLYAERGPIKYREQREEEGQDHD